MIWFSSRCATKETNGTSILMIPSYRKAANCSHALLYLGHICAQYGRIGAGKIGRRAHKQFTIFCHQSGDIRVRIEWTFGDALIESRFIQVIHLRIERLRRTSMQLDYSYVYGSISTELTAVAAAGGNPPVINTHTWRHEQYGLNAYVPQAYNWLPLFCKTII